MVARFVVCGLINLETTARIEGFPLAYNPVNYPFQGVNSTISGVGFNVARALATLGDRVDLLSYLGEDPVGRNLRAWMAEQGMSDRGVLPGPTASPQSVILFDPAGRRQIHVDLKSVQELAYPVERFAEAAQDADLAVLCNINFARPLLAEARRLGKPVATDVHAITRLDDEYNLEFLRQAEILFMSHEGLSCPPEDWAREILARFPARVVVIGLGHEGAVLARRDTGTIRRFPAAPPPRVVNTIGAGDALFAAFLHWYGRDRDPETALVHAQVSASLKIAGAGGADSLPTEAEVLARLQSLNGAGPTTAMGRDGGAHVWRTSGGPSPS